MPIFKYKDILTKQLLKKEYIINKKSTRQIGKQVNLHPEFVRRYLKLYNIKIRNRSEAMRGKSGGCCKGKLAHNYIDGRTLKKYYCKVCGNKIAYRTWQSGQGRCWTCASVVRWQDKEYRESQIRKLRKACILKPNKPEKFLNKLLSKVLPKEYEYVGNAKIFIEGFNPDFININGQKKLIEYFGNYWHKKSEIKERDNRRLIAYDRYGYKTLIIWEKELKDLEKLKDKILKFNKTKS